MGGCPNDLLHAHGPTPLSSAAPRPYELTWTRTRIRQTQVKLCKDRLISTCRGGCSNDLRAFCLCATSCAPFSVGATLVSTTVALWYGRATVGSRWAICGWHSCWLGRDPCEEGGPGRDRWDAGGPGPPCEPVVNVAVSGAPEDERRWCPLPNRLNSLPPDPPDLERVWPRRILFFGFSMPQAAPPSSTALTMTLSGTRASQMHDASE